MNLLLKLIFGAIIMFAALQTNAKISVEEFYNIKFNSLPLIMGVVNLTPDSFSDGGKYNNYRDALKRAKNYIKAGFFLN